MLRMRLLQLCLSGKASADTEYQINASNDLGKQEKIGGKYLEQFDECIILTAHQK